MTTRGRPRGPTNAMTPRREQVLETISEARQAGERLSWAEIARRCRLPNYNHARRIARDLERIGVI